MAVPALKELLRQRIILQLQAAHEAQLGAAALAHDEAIHEESRPENKYDTHSQEAAYLAEGQAKLATEIAESIRLFQNIALPEFEANTPLALGALVQLTTANGANWFFLGPRAGGLEIKLPDLGLVCVLTPQSPFGRQFIGKRVGDGVVLPGQNALATISQVL